MHFTRPYLHKIKFNTQQRKARSMLYKEHNVIVLTSNIYTRTVFQFLLFVSRETFCKKMSLIEIQLFFHAHHVVS